MIYSIENTIVNSKTKEEVVVEEKNLKGVWDIVKSHKSKIEEELKESVERLVVDFEMEDEDIDKEVMFTDLTIGAPMQINIAFEWYIESLHDEAHAVAYQSLTESKQIRNMMSNILEKLESLYLGSSFEYSEDFETDM